MKNLSKDEKRERKYGETSTWEFSAVTPYFKLLFHPKTFVKTWQFVASILRNFFWLQEKQVLHISHRPVINVETELDQKIPFTPSKVGIYLGFIPFFVRPMDMLIKRLGFKKAAPYINRNLFMLAKSYKEASLVYRFSMSTTNRPNYKEDAAFKTIHAADPHLLCVPSLHVAICAVTYSWYKKVFDEGLFPKEEAERRLSEIRARALAIIESVLFVKQHSVNCIPTALYMITSIFEEDFLPQKKALEIINELFKTSPEIDSETKKEITEYFTAMYKRCLNERKEGGSWQEPVINWLKEYAAKTGQKI